VPRRALAAGKTVYMAVPRPRADKCFLRLDPAEIEDIDAATTLAGSTEYGVPVEPAQLEPIDLAVVGSVVVSTVGDRIGKGEGYSDLEYAMLREFDKIDADAPVATTVHELQIVNERFETTRHDVSLDLIVTPEQLLTPPDPAPKPTGIEWDALRAEQREEIPILRHFRP
jgi:5-formyltetrahydrofolate cyclo-ligase